MFDVFYFFWFFFFLFLGAEGKALEMRWLQPLIYPSFPPPAGVLGQEVYTARVYC